MDEQTDGGIKLGGGGELLCLHVYVSSELDLQVNLTVDDLYSGQGDDSAKN